MKRRPDIIIIIISRFFATACFICLLSCSDTDNLLQKPTLPARFITAQHLFAVCAPAPEKIWIGGYQATLMHSSDAGSTWAKQNPGTFRDICSICFIDDHTGWAVGKLGTIIKTTDGGVNWSQQNCPGENHLFDVFFTDQNNGWAVGYQATLLRTNDGGVTWLDCHTQAKTALDEQLKREQDVFILRPRDPSLNAVYALDADNVWIAAEYGTILHSSDGGTTWQIQGCRDIYPVVSETEWLSPMPSLYSIFFKDKKNGWAAGMDGVILHTSDGGSGWTVMASGLAQGKPTLYAIKVIGSRGWALGQFGEYTMSQDGGKTWEKKTGALKTRRWLRDMDFCDEHHGWAVGEQGTVVRTTDGGETWTMLSGIPLKLSDF